MIKDIILGWLECFGKNYSVVGYVLEAPQNKSQKLFWGVTLVILPRVARIRNQWPFQEPIYILEVPTICKVYRAM